MTVKAKALNILRKARALIAKPEGWTQGAWARDAQGGRVYHDAPEAFCFCPVAAIYRVAGVTGPDASADAPDVMEAVRMVAFELASDDPALEGYDEDDLRSALGTNELINMNDIPDTKHHEILAAFDAAISAGVIHRQARCRILACL